MEMKIVSLRGRRVRSESRSLRASKALIVINEFAIELTRPDRLHLDEPLRWSLIASAFPPALPIGDQQTYTLEPASWSLTPAKPSEEQEWLDEALAMTFPASDPVASAPAREPDHSSLHETDVTPERTASMRASKERTAEQSLAVVRRRASLATPTDLGRPATRDIAAAMNAILADTFALYLKTKNFHWHMSGPHFRDYHLLLDEQADQIHAMTDPIAERVRKIGGSTLRSVGHIARLQRVLDNDAEYVSPASMLAELRGDNLELVSRLREAHGVCDEHQDVATASLIEVWIDETEWRSWFLFEAGRTSAGLPSAP